MHVKFLKSIKFSDRGLRNGWDIEGGGGGGESGPAMYV